MDYFQLNNYLKFPPLILTFDLIVVLVNLICTCPVLILFVSTPPSPPK